MTFRIIILVGFVWSNLVIGSINYSPVKSEGTLIFYFDVASFRATLGRTINEFYHTIPTNQLNFTQTTEGFIDTLRFDIQLTDSSNQQLIDKQWLEPIFIDSLQKLTGKFLPQQLEITLQPGNYVAYFVIGEIKTGVSGTTVLEFHVPSYHVDSLKLSDIQIASSISRELPEGSPFVKNGINIVPNPNRLFSEALPILYFYFEIYNLKPTDNPEKNQYEIVYRIYDSNDSLIKEYSTKVKNKPGTTSFDVGGINVSLFEQPSLKLLVSVTDKLTGQTASAEKKFWIMPKTRLSSSPAIQNQIAERINGMTEQDLEEHVSQIKYILPQQAISDYHKLDFEGKKNFLTTFWISNDPNPETPQNEFWDEYFKKVEYVNQHFSSSLIKGWKTDRGRIYLKYGKPYEVEYYPLTINDKPFEIWQYVQPEQMKFIFVDEEGFGRYRLIYSSDEKETTDPNWRNIITLPY